MPFDHAPPGTPPVTTDQMIEVDRLMMEDYKIGLIQMMENAGRNLAHFTRVRVLDGSATGRHVVVLAGSGGNGGGALVAARRLSGWGCDVTVALGQTDDKFADIPAHQLRIVRRMGIDVVRVGEDPGSITPDAVLDGLIGYSLKGPPRGHVRHLIEWANTNDAPVVALDTPSGMDTTSGTVFDPAIRALATLTLALPKTGLLPEQTRKWVGELYCADISVPPGLYAEPTIGLEVPPLFSANDIIRIL